MDNRINFLRIREITLNKKAWGFTLVELVVVITILAILGTIGFLAVSGYSTRARDSERTSDLTQLSKAMEFKLSAGGVLPQPDASLVTLTASGTTIGYQGYAGSNLLRVLNLGWKFQDSMDGKYYSYLTDANGTKYQLLGFLENTLATSELPGISNAYAWTYDTRIPVSKGTSLGMLLGVGANLNQPVQELGVTSLDVLATTSTYSAYFSRTDSVTGTGTKLAILKASLTSSPKIPSYDSSMVGYWDMETTTPDGKLADLSGNGNNGTVNGGAQVGGVAGIRGKGMYFDGVNDSVVVPNATNLQLTGSLTLVANLNFVQYPTSWASILGKMTNDNNNEFNLRVQNATSGDFYYGNGSSACSTVVSRPSSSYPINKFTQIVAVRNFATGKSSIYVNGVETHTGGTCWTSSIATTSGLYFANENGGPYYLNATYDEVRAYNRALSEGEIRTLYDATK